MKRNQKLQQKGSDPSWFRFGWEWLLVGVLLAVCLALTLWTARDVGNTTDEQSYRKVGAIHLEWFEILLGMKEGSAFSPEVLGSHWCPRNEEGAVLSNHPPLGAFFMALSMRVFQAWLGPIVASRIATAFFFVVLLGAVYVFVRGQYGIAAAAFAALSLLLMPRVFGHAHVAALDMMMATMAFLATVCFVKGMKSKRWSVVYGIFLGLALLTKVNAFFLPIPLLVWGLLHERRRILPNLFSTFVIALAVFYILWPWLWYSPGAHMDEYIGRQLAHGAVHVYYLGETYPGNSAPWHYPLVLTGLTLPVALVPPMLIGLLSAIREGGKRIGLLLILSAAVPLGVAAVPGTLKYDGVRLFLPAFPFLACLAGVGFGAIASLLTRSGAGSPGGKTFRRVAVPVIGLALLVSPVVWTVRYHPYYLSYYNEFAGGLRGASAMGLEETYWGDAVNRDVWQYLLDAAQSEDGTRRPKVLYLGPWDAPEIYQNRYAKFRLDALDLENEMIVVGNQIRLPDYILLNCRKGMFNEAMWKLYRDEGDCYTRTATFEFDGVPLVMVFKRKADAPTTCPEPADSSP